MSASVTLASTDDTNAEVVAALNANADFSAIAKASESGGFVKIETREAGAHKYIKVTSTLSTAFGASGKEAFGKDADYAVLLQYVDLQDESGSARDGEARLARIGYFDESNLINLTPEARATLARRGSIFA